MSSNKSESDKDELHSWSEYKHKDEDEGNIGVLSHPSVWPVCC